MVQFECPRYRNPCVTSIFGEFTFLKAFSHFQPLWGNKELDRPVWYVKYCKKFWTKSAERAANGPIWMPQVQKPLCHIHFWWIPFSHFQPLWGNKELDLPVWYVKCCKIIETKSAEWAANGPIWMPLVQKPLCHINFCWIPFSHFQPLLGNKELDLPVWYVKCCKLIWTKLAERAANGPIWMPQVQKPLCHIHFLWIPFSHFQPLWGNKELGLPVWYVKCWKIIGTKLAERAANGPIWMPQVQKPLCHIHLWWIPFSHFQPPWDNKELGLPVWYVKCCKIIGTKISRTGCKWSNLNAPGSETSVSHPFLVNSLFSFSAPLG